MKEYNFITYISTTKITRTTEQIQFLKKIELDFIPFKGLTIETSKDEQIIISEVIYVMKSNTFWYCDFSKLHELTDNIIVSKGHFLNETITTVLNELIDKYQKLGWTLNLIHNSDVKKFLKE